MDHFVLALRLKIIILGVVGVVGTVKLTLLYGVGAFMPTLVIGNITTIACFTHTLAMRFMLKLIGDRFVL